jgi:hypothetical protein
MTLLPKVKLKAAVNFPATVLDGTGIDVTKSNGTYRFDLDFGDFAPPVASLPDATHQHALVWNSLTGAYLLAPVSVFSGTVTDAPLDSKVYGRLNGTWVNAWNSPTLTGTPAAPTPSPGDNDTSIATTAFVTAAIAAIGAGAVPASATPIIESGAGAVGVSVKYAREDHIHPLSGTTFLQAGTGAVTRVAQDKMRESVSVLDFGAAGNGSITASGTGTDDSTAFFQAWSTGRQVIVPPGNYRLTSSGLHLVGTAGFVFLPGAVVCPDAGVTIQFNTLVQAGRYRIFGNNGTITGIRSVYPEWWGAVHDGTTDDAPAINKAIASVENSASSVGGEYSLTFDKGVYAIASTITFSPTATIQWRIRGAGCVFGTQILAKSAFSGTYAVLLQGSTDLSVQLIADWSISNLSISQQVAGSGAFAGLGIGSTGTFLSGYQCSLIEDIRVNGFDFNFLYRNVRLVETRRCAAWCGANNGVERANSVGFYITADNPPNLNMGDMTWINCQAVAPGHNSGTASGKCLRINTGTTYIGKTFGGFRFIGFVCYGGAIQAELIATNGNTLADVWFTGGSQFEGGYTGTTTAIYMEANGATSILYDIHIDGCYMSGNGFLNHVKATCPSAGELTDLFITNNWLPNPNSGGAAIDIRGTGGIRCQSVTVTGNIVRDSHAVGGDGMYFENVSQITVNNNSLTGTATGLTNFIKFNTGGNWLVAQGNNRGGLATNAVTNTTGAANTSIANNL